jgi:hypothetical protein
MERQIKAILTLGCFTIFSVSCSSVQEIKPSVLASQGGKNADIIRLKKNSGESIVFSEDRPGRVVGNAIAGMGAVEMTQTPMEIDKSQIKTIDRRGNSLVAVTTRDNKTYLTEKIVEKQESIEMRVQTRVRPLLFESMRIVLTEVEKASAKMPDVGNTILAIVCLLVIPVAIVMSLSGSFNFGSPGIGVRALLDFNP